MLKHVKIEVQQELSYYIQGNPENSTEVFFLFHGYAQSADDMFEIFNDIIPSNACSIYFEGSSHFYSKGVKGKSVNSWMTSKYRELQITNHLAYIDTTIKSLNLNNNTQITAIAFSQGVATLSRYVASFPEIGLRCFFIGSPPAEEYQKFPTKRKNDLLIVGEKDRYIEINSLKNLEIETIKFDGGHEIPKKIIKTLILNT